MVLQHGREVLLPDHFRRGSRIDCLPECLDVGAVALSRDRTFGILL